MTQFQRRKPLDAKPERTIITGLIVNGDFCKAIIPILKDHPNILAISFTKTISRWIIDYWDRYGKKSPIRDMQDIFDKKKDDYDDGVAEAIKNFLQSISDEYETKQEDFNPEYQIAQAIEYFQARQIEILKGELRKSSSSIEDAQKLKLIKEFSPITLINVVDELESEGHTMKEVFEMDIPEVQWIVNEIIPAVGLTVLAAKPKTGKSSLIFNIALDVALGREIFNKIPVEGPAEVLYLALEDSQDRIKNRGIDILKKDTPPKNCTIFLQEEWSKKISQGGIRKLEEWMVDHPETKLIIIDTLQKIRDPHQKKPGQSYSDDYQALESLQAFAGKHRIAVIVVHHSRKTKADNVFDEISGTTGLTAAVDTLAVMKRVSGKEDDRVLHIRGRDFADKKIVFSLVSDYRWELKGDAPEFLVLESKQRRIIVNYLKMVDGPVQRKELVEKTKNKIGKGVDTLIKKLVNEGRIEKVEYGVYARRGFKRDQRHGKIVEFHRKKLNRSRRNKDTQKAIGI